MCMFWEGWYLVCGNLDHKIKYVMQKNIGILYQRQYKCTAAVTQKDTVLLKCNEGKSFSLVSAVFTKVTVYTIHKKKLLENCVGYNTYIEYLYWVLRKSWHNINKQLFEALLAITQQKMNETAKVKRQECCIFHGGTVLGTEYSALWPPTTIWGLAHLYPPWYPWVSHVAVMVKTHLPM